VQGPKNYLSLLVNRARMEGIVVFDYADRYHLAVAEMAGYLKDGRMKSKEDVVRGRACLPRSTCSSCSTARTSASWCWKWLAASAPNTTHVCTTAPRSEWMPADEMQLLATHRGYRIKTFKVSKGNCYELYGFDREGRIVEAYFDPITARLKLQNIAN
jgi:hypothetical protein